MGAENRVDGRERIVERALHEHLTQHLRDQHLAPAGRGEDARARAGGGLGEVERAEDARFAFDELEHVGLVEGVIAQRDHVRARVEKSTRMQRRQPRAGGRVLAVHHDEIEPPVGPEFREAVGHRGPARPPDDVAKEEKSHATRRRRGRGRGQAPILPPRDV